MDTEFIFIYCLAETVVSALRLEEESQAKMNNAEIITFVVISAIYYQCNYKLTRLVCSNFKLFSSLLSQSRINRRVHQIPETVWMMIFTICRSYKAISKEFIVDSFPVASCQNYKRFRCKLFTDNKFHGYTASKKQYFFGIKVHMIVSTNGIPVEFVFTPGAESDIRGFNRLPLELPTRSILFGDKAYTNYGLEDLLKNDLGIELIVKRKKNSKRPHSLDQNLRLSLTRNKIETVFSSGCFINAKMYKGSQ